MKYNLPYRVLICIFLITQIANSQSDFILKQHTEFKTDKREIPDQYIGSNDQGHYFLYSKGKYGYGSTSLVKFDLTYNQTGQKIALVEDTPKEEDEKEFTLGVIELNNKLLCLTAKASKTHRKYYTKTVDLDKFDLSSSKEIIDLSIDDVDMNKTYISFIKAKDDSSVGLFYSLPTEKNGTSKKYGLIIFDEDFNKINEYEYEFPSTKDSFVIVEGMLTNKEEMVILTADLSNVPANPNSKKIPQYNYKVLLLKNNKNELVAEIPNYDKWVNNIELFIDESFISLCGFYSNIGRYNSHGTFLYNIDRSDFNKTISKFNPFSQKLLDSHSNNLLAGNAQKKKINKFKELTYYIPKSYYKFNNDAILMIAEQIHTVSSNYSTMYYYENLIIICTDKNGNQLWSKMIKKNNSKNSTWVYSSFTGFAENDQYYIIYNDSDKNLINSDTRRYNAFSFEENESIVVTSIKKDGTIKSEAITNKPKINGFRMRPGISTKLNNNEVLLFAQKPSNVKHQKFMTLEIKKD